MTKSKIIFNQYLKYCKVYKEKFGSTFPQMYFMEKSIEELCEILEEAINSNKPVKITLVEEAVY